MRVGLALALPRRRFVVRGPSSSKSICLTFDDGPHPEHTPRLLDVLAEQGVKATFFVIGEKAQQYPEIVARMTAEGHVVGQHSWTHSEPRTTSTRVLLDEVERTGALLARITGQPATLFRPPKGELSASKLVGLMRAGLTVVLWSADPKDYAQTSAEGVANWLVKHPPRSGDIVLMHDVYPFAAEVLPALTERVRRKELKFAHPLAWRGVGGVKKEEVRVLNS